MPAAPKPDFVELVLTCGSWQEAQRIVDSLLEKRLIACAEMIQVESKFSWKQKINEGREIKLVMQSRSDLFDKIEAEIAKLHSYETFVLRAIPMTYVSKQATKWLEETLDDKIGGNE